MSVIALTVLVGLLLVLFFVVFFLVQHSKNRSSYERDALMPLQDEPPRVQTIRKMKDQA